MDAIRKDQAGACAILYQHGQGMPPQKRRSRVSVTLNTQKGNVVQSGSLIIKK